MLSFHQPPETIYRVGPTGKSWELIDWKYVDIGRDGRWDDPNGTYRIRYAAFAPAGALVEKLQRYRPDLAALAGQNEIEGDGDPVEPILPYSWFEKNEIGIASMILEEVELLDLTSGAGISAAAPAIHAAERKTGSALKNFDATTLMKTDREFTQAFSRYVYDLYRFAGIVYRSRFAPELLCVALFEGRHNLAIQTARKIRPTEPDFSLARQIHGFNVEKPNSPVDANI